MSDIDLEQGTIGSGRLSFAESEASEYFTDGEDHVVTCFHSNTLVYHTGNDEYYSRSVSSSKSTKLQDRACRICQVEVGSDGQDLIKLGCSCKEDLAFAHQLCAQTWFKLKGDKVCEICNSVVTNVAGANERMEEEVAVVVEGGGGDAAVAENRESWWGRRSMMIILLIWVFAFLIFYLQSNFKLFSNF